MAETTEDARVAAFIARWAQSGGAEQANSQSFLSELCRDVLGVDPPQPSLPDEALNSYVFERGVRFDNGDGTSSTGRIDLYRRGCFVLESKQGVLRREAEEAQRLQAAGLNPRKRGAAVRGTPGWAQAMRRAKGQAESYIRALPADEGRPPFLLVVDVGHTIEVYAEFSRTGGAYTPFPDAAHHRLRLDQLAEAEVRGLLRTLWTDPLSLDPSRRSAQVTREIAEHLAALAKSLEADGHGPDTVATFLMRCLFTMFAEDVELLPKRSFTDLLSGLRDQPAIFRRMVEDLWRAMKVGDFSAAVRVRTRHFNGALFEQATALDLTQPQIDLLLEASRADWRHVEPAIFGTLLERALSPRERHKLGAHYTPRAYVERLVLPTVIEPLREQWDAAQAAATLLAPEAARAELRRFHRELCELRVLDPACGSGNFLYVTLEHLKRLEAEVLDALRALGETQAALEGTHATVGPHQFLGIEVNPRAARIAELVLWIGYLQWHVRTHGSAHVPEPVIGDFHKIECRDAVLAWDSTRLVLDEHHQPVTRWDGFSTRPHPVTGEEVPDETMRVPVYEYVNPRPATWPEAEYVVGNPPFIGCKMMRAVLGDGYVDALRTTLDQVPSSADYVMYWWDKAAEIAGRQGVRRFGFITTNSITQTFNRQVLARHLGVAGRLHLAFAVPDHPWVDTAAGASVRIAMTTAAPGPGPGLLAKVVSEQVLADGESLVAVRLTEGDIAVDFAVGPSLAAVTALTANSRLCGFGCALHGAGFILDAADAAALRASAPAAAGQAIIRPYANGRDVAGRSRGAFVIDFSGLDRDAAAAVHPAAYQRVLVRVKPERDLNRRDSIRRLWWRFGWERPTLREALRGLRRFIATPETAKHRFFVFLPSEVVPDHMLVNVASEDALLLGVLSSRVHTAWALAAGGTLEDRPRWNNTRCFDPFPFPAATPAQQARIRDLGEQLDAHRKRQQALHPELTLTDMYNVLERLRAIRGTAVSAAVGLPSEHRRDADATAKERRVHEQGLVSVLLQIHDDLDAAVFDAYGWDLAIGDEELLEKLVALNAERAAEEKAGLVRWLRPEFQNPGGATATQATLLDVAPDVEATPAEARRAWPDKLPAQAAAVRAAVGACATPVTPEQVARLFDRRYTAKLGERVAELLETLADLGQIRRAGDGQYVAVAVAVASASRR